MPRFDKNSVSELKELLYDSYIHDAKLKNIVYEWGLDSITIKLFHPIWGVKIDLTFHNIEVALVIKGKFYGDRESIVSLTVEEDFSYLNSYLSKCHEGYEGAIYLLFQMFSGDELHIVSKEVFVEITR